jgi:hypothetical protein
MLDSHYEIRDIVIDRFTHKTINSHYEFRVID